MTAFREEIIGHCRLILADCLDVLPTLGKVDAVVTDPPYLTSDSRVPIRGGGVAQRKEDSESVGVPWGYSLDWIDSIDARHWVVFCNYKMLAGVCSALDPSAVFVWKKNNAPRMTRPVPRLDCEFIVWSRRDGETCGRMGEFDSLLLDVPMPQAGCFATERILLPDSGKAAHPCQKPLAVMTPFTDRLDCRLILDPFMGSGTTAVACVNTGREFIGIEREPRYFDIACQRVERAWQDKQSELPFDKPAKLTQRSLMEVS